MSFFCRLSGRHYWCTPHRSSDRRKLIQVCYECGAERPVLDLVDDLAVERLNQSLAAARSQMGRASGRIDDASRDQIAANGGSRKLALIK